VRPILPQTRCSFFLLLSLELRPPSRVIACFPLLTPRQMAPSSSPICRAYFFATTAFTDASSFFRLFDLQSKCASPLPSLLVGLPPASFPPPVFHTFHCLCCRTVYQTTVFPLLFLNGRIFYFQKEPCFLLEPHFSFASISPFTSRELSL